MTKLEAWIEEKKKHFDDFGSLSEYDAKKALSLVEKLKTTIESLDLHCCGATCDQHNMGSHERYDAILAIDPESVDV